jgi:hypothetical protein
MNLSATNLAFLSGTRRLKYFSLKSFNAVIVEVQNRHLKGDRRFRAAPFFHSKMKIYFNSTTTLIPALVMAAVVTIL